MASSSFGIAKQGIITQSLSVEQNSADNDAHAVFVASFKRSDEIQRLNYEDVKYVVESQISDGDEDIHAVLVASANTPTNGAEYSIKYKTVALTSEAAASGGSSSNSGPSIHWIG